MEIPKEYPIVVSVAVAANIHCWMQGIKITRMRKEIFTKEFMRHHWGEIHKSEMGESIVHLGYPDMGNGIYSQKLSYG